MTKNCTQQTSEQKLQEENAVLKTILKRYLVFGEPGRLNNLETGVSHQLAYTEKVNAMMFDNMLTPAFAGDIIYENNNAVDFLYTQVNPKFTEFADTTADNIIGKTASRTGILNPEIWTKPLAHTAETQLPFSGEISCKGNTYNVTAFATHKGSFIAMFQNSNPVAEAESKIKANLKFTQMMIDAIPTPVFCKDMEGRYTLCNQSYSKDIIGVSPDIIIGKTALQLENLFPKKYADFYQEKDIELIKDQGIQVYEGPIKCADGIVREYIVNKTLIKNDEDKFVGILGVMQDIDRMIKARRELAESEIRYKTLFNGISQPIIVVDTEGNIIMLNTTAVELFEDDNELSSNNEYIPATQMIDMPLIKKISETGEILTRKVCIKVKGVERWYLSTMQPINDFFGEKVIQIISNDITEIKRYQTELLSQKKKAEESNNLKTIFLANIAHETRTPVNIINGFVQMIQNGMAADKEKDYLNLIYTNCKKLLDIIDDIVELSMIETGQKTLRREICSINSFVEESFAYLQESLIEVKKNIHAIKDCNIIETDSLVFADSLCVNQIFKKLITNAVTFTNTGNITIGAYIKQPDTPEGSAQIAFYVTDTGIGIADDKKKLIFERFRQGDEGQARQYGGNGLGLSIANELVMRMGGNIQVESQKDVGSTFTFYIPYQKAGI